MSSSVEGVVSLQKLQKWSPLQTSPGPEKYENKWINGYKTMSVLGTIGCKEYVSVSSAFPGDNTTIFCGCRAREKRLKGPPEIEEREVQNIMALRFPLRKLSHFHCVKSSSWVPAAKSFHALPRQPQSLLSDGWMPSQGTAVQQDPKNVRIYRSGRSKHANHSPQLHNRGWELPAVVARHRI